MKSAVNIYKLYTLYAKLFARITESSLMEEQIDVRYTFMMLLAIADPEGYVIGTDIAIARRLNMPIELFVNCVNSLSKPDADSNSKEQEGRRLVPSDGERGYKIVNYVAYRDMRDQAEKREYMKLYMREYRAGKAAVKAGKKGLTKLGQEAVPAPDVLDTSLPEALKAPDAETIYDAYPLKKARPDALRAISKQLTRFSPVHLLERTTAYARARGADLSFVPNPATWFNGERFNDDPSTWTSNERATSGKRNAQPHRNDHIAGSTEYQAAASEALRAMARKGPANLKPPGPAGTDPGNVAGR